MIICKIAARPACVAGVDVLNSWHAVAQDLSRMLALQCTGLAPRIFFIFAPLLSEEGGGGSEGRGNFSKIRGKRGKKGGGGGVDAGKGSGAFLGERGP